MLHSVRRYPPLRFLLLGSMSTTSAFWMYQVAVGWLALELTDSPLFVGLAGFASGIPFLICSIPAGVIIDRFDRRTVLRLAQGGAMAVSTLFAVLVGADLIAPWSMLVLVATSGTIISFIFPTHNAIIPSLVQRGDLANALALNAASQNVTRIIGPSLAGTMIAAIGVAGAFAGAAVLQTLALLATTRVPATNAEPSERGAAGWKNLTLGLRIVARDPALVALILLALAPTVLVMPYLNLMPVFARDELGIGSSGLGLLLASTGLGSVTGALTVARSPRLRSRAGIEIVTAAAFATVVLIFAHTPVVPAALPLLFAAGWTSAVFLSLNQTTVQLRVDDAVRGRVLSIYLLTWGMLPLGQLAVGALANQVGAPLAMTISCLLALGCIVLVVRRYPSLRA
jgi:MFS family permease